MTKIKIESKGPLSKEEFGKYMDKFKAKVMKEDILSDFRSHMVHETKGQERRRNNRYVNHVKNKLEARARSVQTYWRQRGRRISYPQAIQYVTKQHDARLKIVG